MLDFKKLAPARLAYNVSEIYDVLAKQKYSEAQSNQRVQSVYRLLCAGRVETYWYNSHNQGWLCFTWF